MLASHPTGNVAHDAPLAALVVEHGVQELRTADHDFARSPGVHPRHPFGGDHRLAERGETDYLPLGWWYGLLPEAWSVMSTTLLISGTWSTIAFTTPWLRVTFAMPHPWQPPPMRT